MVSIVRRTGALLALAALAAVMAGCAKSSQPIATGKGEIRGINAIVGAPEVQFRIEERNIGSIAFKQGTTYDRYDNLTYNFNFDLFLPNVDDPVRLASSSLDVKTDRRYTFVLTGTLDEPSTLLWTDKVRTWEDPDTVFEASFAHLAPTVGNVDVYFAPPGTEPKDGQPVATLSYGQREAGMDFESGVFKLFLTRKGKPKEILFRSERLNTRAQSRVTIAIFDTDATVTAPIAVNVINDIGSSAPIPEVDSPAQLRIVHAAVDIDDIDAYFAEDFDNPVFQDVAQREITAYADVAEVTTKLTITPAGNVGTILREADVGVVSGARRTVLLGGMLAEPFFFVVDDNGRSLEPFPVVRLINIAGNEDFINAYLVEPGTDIDGVLFPTISALPTRVDTGFFPATEGDRELIVTALGEKEPLAGPFPLNLRNGDVVDLALLDTADPNVLELLLLSP